MLSFQDIFVSPVVGRDGVGTDWGKPIIGRFCFFGSKAEVQVCVETVNPNLL